MISKELLGEVLKADIRKINNSILDGNLYYYKTFVKCKSKINIYELAFKCKEWALEHDCELLSCIRSKDRAICDIYSDKYNCKFTHYADIEPEAIFRACQWILDKDSK